MAKIIQAQHDPSFHLKGLCKGQTSFLFAHQHRAFFFVSETKIAFTSSLSSIGHRLQSSLLQFQPETSTMAISGLLAAIKTSLLNWNENEARNSTNFGAHEVAHGKVTYQEEGGIHLLEFHVPTTGTTPVLISLAVAAIFLILITALCLKTCGAFCRATTRCICPCSTWCRRTNNEVKIEEPSEDEDDETKNPFVAPVPNNIQHDNENGYQLVPVLQQK